MDLQCISLLLKCIGNVSKRIGNALQRIFNTLKMHYNEKTLQRYFRYACFSQIGSHIKQRSAGGPPKILKEINTIVNSILNFTGSQCKSTNKGVM